MGLEQPGDYQTASNPEMALGDLKPAEQSQEQNPCLPTL